MTIEQRLEQLELQNQRIERQSQHIEHKNKRLTAALAVMVVAMAAVVTMAATGEKNADFDSVTARHIWVKNDAGDRLVALGAINNSGAISVFNKTGEDVVQVGVDEYGNGVVFAGNRKGKGRTLQPGP